MKAEPEKLRIVFLNVIYSNTNTVELRNIFIN